MEQKIKFVGMMGLIAIFVVVVLISGCVEEKPKENLTETKNLTAQEKIIVGVTILPQAEFVEKIGGDKVKVVVMVPPGASPHTYEPTPNQMIDLSNAKMYAAVGSGIEFEIAQMDKIRDVNKDMLVINCSNGIEFMEMLKDEEEHEEHHHKGNKDPHVWLSVKNAKIMVKNIYDGLVKIDPENKEYYKTNMEAYIAELDKVDKEISEKLSNLSNRKILVYHPAWGYFCRDYNLTQIAIEKEGKEPTPQGIQNLIKQAKENDIHVIFTSPQFSTKNAEVIANEINGSVVPINPLAKNYTENMYRIADAFSKV